MVLGRYLSLSLFLLVMKHTWGVVCLLLLFFLLVQVFGLFVVAHYTEEEALPLGIERPAIDARTSFVTLLLTLSVATILLLLLLHFRFFLLWKVWFFLCVFLALIVSWSVFLPVSFAGIFAGIFSLWRILKPGVFVQNFTELFLYGAFAAIFVPLLNLFWVALLLLAVSLYDYISVRKTKHMVVLAESQKETKTFAGLLIPYKKSVALLGGGDMGFPLLFSAVVMGRFSLGVFDWRTYIVPFCAGLLLFVLFVKGEKRTYYPALPYVTLGCFLGLGILLLVL